ncbi:hypothetical protein ILUMI_19835 [Ignelater luminosus]|uniref:Uncharacterized protein n=1 Tax=Ignelater luminosus TaxID=2038154 RepID=A0A8K0CHG0_IGNLU|nr:hypothetical protein ILUMI_19835 [Ignelater luminosus]
MNFKLGYSIAIFTHVVIITFANIEKSFSTGRKFRPPATTIRCLNDNECHKFGYLHCQYMRCGLRRLAPIGRSRKPVKHSRRFNPFALPSFSIFFEKLKWSGNLVVQF